MPNTNDIPVNATLRSRTRDGREHEHPVSLRRSRGGALILNFGDAPGGWTIVDLIDIGDTMALDFGQGWIALNMRQVVRAALKAALVELAARLGRAERGLNTDELAEAQGFAPLRGGRS